MALATQCPYCHTTFRVANDQLKLRAGLVRCGACKEIFNGIEHLLGSAAAAPATAPIDPATPAENSPRIAPEAESANRSAALSASLDFQLDEPPHAVASDAADDPAEPAATQDLTEALQQGEQAAPSELRSAPLEQAGDPLQRMTLMMEYSEVDGAEPSLVAAAANIDDPLDRVIEDLQRKPWRRGNRKLFAPKAASAEQVDPNLPAFAEPDFVTQGKRRQKVGRALRISTAIGSCVLLVGLLAQGAYSFRSQIAARLPQAKPMLARACSVLGCRLDLPTRIDALTIESSELQAVPGQPDMFILTTLLRNDSATVQAWPNIELTLNDVNDQALARRVFTPADYLAAVQDAPKGFAPSSEQGVKLFIEVAQLKAAGYRVGLFYP